ncbi:MAG: type II secretion system F family protein [Candidatus Thermoplasmatota archaeon]
MMLNSYQKFCYNKLRGFTEKRSNDKLQKSLESAHMNIRPAAYLAYVWLTSILVIVSILVVLSLLSFVILPFLGVNLDIMLIIILMIIPFLLGGLVYITLLSYPNSKAKARGKKIDLYLPYALNFISAMSSAGITPTEIFKSLSKQEIYGAIQEEASWIYRDVALLGSDIITSIKANIERTPSQKFKEFLQGTVVTVTSGGSLKSYFMAKADQYTRENRQMQKQRIESLGIMAESYVTTAVAGILLLLIVIPLMMIISGSWNPIFLYVLVLLIVPLIHMGFAMVIKMMTAEG